MIHSEPFCNWQISLPAYKISSSFRSLIFKILRNFSPNSGSLNFLVWFPAAMIKVAAYRMLHLQYLSVPFASPPSLSSDNELLAAVSLRSTYFYCTHSSLAMKVAHYFAAKLLSWIKNMLLAELCKETLLQMHLHFVGFLPHQKSNYIRFYSQCNDLASLSWKHSNYSPCNYSPYTLL